MTLSGENLNKAKRDRSNQSERDAETRDQTKCGDDPKVSAQIDRMR